MHESLVHFDVLKNFPIFSDLSDKQIKALQPKVQVLHYKIGEKIIEQGEESDSLYIIIEGQANLTHLVAEKEHALSVLHEGEAIGEISMLDLHPRAVSAVVTKPVTALKIMYADILGEEHLDVQSNLFKSLAKRTSRRLRESRFATVKALEAELAMSKLRVSMAIFIVYLVVFTSIYTILVEPVAELRVDVPGSQRIFSLLLIIAFAIAVFVPMKKGAFPLSMYGLTTQGCKKSVSEALLYSGVLIVLITFIKWCLIQFYPPLQNTDLFNPIESFAVNTPFTPLGFTISLIAYALFCPIQEFIVRGGLQSSFQIFFENHYKSSIWLSIVLSNLLFASAHAYLSTLFAILAFTMGLFWGWLYSRQRNLIGVSISHTLIGVYVLFILGPSGLF